MGSLLLMIVIANLKVYRYWYLSKDEEGGAGAVPV
jgi:hypothetical protein